ncbi:hypothetical protein HF086_017926 [Spodoptera exigua]|uniref:Uncharacterized protein n=1 Tax=Spodoptera exigua TaxID=7107 RepID=A0A922SF40_SPOEX|nr:hypothetical protein HF086_017926 [Spodoptera exigua]
MINYAGLLYNFVYETIVKEDEVISTESLISVTSYFSFMMVPIFGGQLVQNQGLKFHRQIAQLYNKNVVDSETEGKVIKDFLRVIKKNPLKIKLLAKVPLGNHILPLQLSLIVNNVIILLQFNHVI